MSGYGKQDQTVPRRVHLHTIVRIFDSRVIRFRRSQGSVGSSRCGVHTRNHKLRSSSVPAVRPAPFLSPSRFFGFRASFVWDRVRFSKAESGFLCNNPVFCSTSKRELPLTTALSHTHCRLWIIDFFFARLQRGSRPGKSLCTDVLRLSANPSYDHD